MATKTTQKPDLKSLNQAQLTAEIERLRARLNRYWQQLRQGTTTNVRYGQQLRKEIARALTYRRQLELKKPTQRKEVAKNG